VRAPVYRNAAARNTFVGLSFPTEVLLGLSAAWALMLTLPMGLAALFTGAFYVALRLVNYGRAEGFVQQYLTFRARQLLAGGRLSAATRPRIAPRFPFGPYLSRDLPPRRTS
jgi:hypothetical protein